MKGRSLHLRLLLGATLAIFVALVTAWFAMTWLFERHLERKVVTDLMRDAKPLLADLTVNAKGVPRAPHPPIDARFHAPSSGLYWQLSTAGGRLRSRSLWDQTLPPAPHAVAGEWSTRLASGPFGQTLLLLERRVKPGRGAPTVLVQIAHEDATLRQARAQFGHDLMLFLVVLWVVLSVAAAVQVRLGLRPLRRLRHQLPALQGDPAARLGDGHPREVAPLVTAINELAEARQQDLVRARRRAADLAHSLKTPLAAQSRSARRAGAADAAEGLDHAIAAVAAAVDAELARSRIASARRRTAISPLRAIDRLVDVIEHTPAGERVAFDIDVPADLRVPVAEEDLTELLGALLENAARYGRRRVRVGGVSAAASGTQLVVEDDGPGLDADAERELAAGRRLDETGPGHHGLGLVIARELVQATGGRLTLERSPLGGLRVTMWWQAGSAGLPGAGAALSSRGQRQDS